MLFRSPVRTRNTPLVAAICAAALGLVILAGVIVWRTMPTHVDPVPAVSAPPSVTDANAKVGPAPSSASLPVAPTAATSSPTAPPVHPVKGPKVGAVKPVPSVAVPATAKPDILPNR